jgi:fructan beta-fructosidase
VDGDAGNTKWVLVVNLSPGGIAGGSGGQYFLGTFDGAAFVSETTVTEGLQPDDSRLADYGWLDWGRDYYAAVSFSNVPDGRRLMIGWMNNWQYAAATPTTPWRSAMSLVREVRLATRGGRVVLLQEAVDPFEASGAGLYGMAGQPLAAGTRWLPAEASGDVLRIDAEFEPGPAGEVGLVLRGGLGSGPEERTVLAYDSGSGLLRLDRIASGNTDFHESFASVERVAVPLEDGRLRLRIFLDRCSVEVFAQDGLATITDLVFPAGSSTAVGMFADRDGGTLVRLDVVG